MEHKFTVDVFKTRLDKYLAEQLSEISRSQIQRDIEDGCVFVNDQIITESKFAVRQGDSIKYQVLSIKNGERLKPTSTPLKVLYNDNGLIIIDKPAGMVVHPGAGFRGETLASALLYNFSAKGGSAFGGQDISLVGEEHRPGIVHRLDKDTSGVILVAKDQGMYEHLKNAFQDRKIKKEYVALVCGRVEKAHGFVDALIGKSKSDFRKYDVKNIIEPKESLTEYQVLEYLESGNGEMGKKGSMGSKGEGAESPERSRGVDRYTLILVKLHTGRTHQIRVHMASIGHPLAGDQLYGGKKASLKGLGRQFLHAKRIEVRLPDGTWIEAESDLPSDLREVLEKFGSKVVKSL